MKARPRRSSTSTPLGACQRCVVVVRPGRHLGGRRQDARTGRLRDRTRVSATAQAITLQRPGLRPELQPGLNQQHDAESGRRARGIRLDFRRRGHRRPGRETWAKIDSDFKVNDGAWQDLKFGVRYEDHDRVSNSGDRARVRSRPVKALRPIRRPFRTIRRISTRLAARFRPASGIGRRSSCKPTTAPPTSTAIR